MNKKFRIYYGDGSTYSDRDGSPYDAPAEDVQIIAIEMDTPQGFGLIHGGESERGCDVYMYRDGTWFGSDKNGHGLASYLRELGPRKVIFGRTMTSTDAFWKIVGRASREGLG